MRIGELARRTGTAVETIRYYEREHLLPEPQRTAANYSFASAAHSTFLCKKFAHCLQCAITPMAPASLPTRW